MRRGWKTCACALALLSSGCLRRVLPPTQPIPLPESPLVAVTGSQATTPAVAAAADSPASPAAGASGGATEGAGAVASPSMERVRSLEAQLAARDSEIAAVRSELETVREQALGGGGTAPTAAATTGAPAGRSAAALVEAEQQISTLQSRLEAEIDRRKEVEAEMSRVLEETSAGPYDRAEDAVATRLRQDLKAAHGEIADLRTTIATERRQRGELERRFAALEARAGSGNDGMTGGEEMAALKERQRRVLASIRQDLEASRERETELRATLERTHGSDGTVLATEVSGLRAENTALQRRLDEEHKRNQALAQKVKLAGRVTDLIFKMQSSGAVQAAPALPAR